jgi:hypothetical protein
LLQFNSLCQRPKTIGLGFALILALMERVLQQDNHYKCNAIF